MLLIDKEFLFWIRFSVQQKSLLFHCEHTVQTLALASLNERTGTRSKDETENKENKERSEFFV